MASSTSLLAGVRVGVGVGVGPFLRKPGPEVRDWVLARAWESRSSKGGGGPWENYRVG